MKRSLIVYRDLLLAPSEAFVPRCYVGFEELEPRYLATKRGAALERLGSEAQFVEGFGGLGPASTAAFKQLGHVSGAMRRWLDETAPAAVHAHFGRGGALALPVARAAKRPLVVTFHGGDVTKDKHFEHTALAPPTIFQRRWPAMRREVALFHCVSAFIRDRLIRRGAPPERTLVNHLGIELPPIDGALPDPASQQLLFVGRFVDKKGVEDALAAVASLRSHLAGLELVLVGDGPLRSQLEQAAKRSQIACTFTGWLSPAEVSTAMSSALALLVPSRTAATGDSEGLPTVVLEAQARGLPVIATRHAGIPEAVTDGVTGLLVPERDPAALAAAIVRIVASPDDYRRIQAAGLHSVAEGFDAVRQSRRLEAMILDVAKDARPV